MAENHADWVLGSQDETWWSRLALPALHAWTGEGGQSRPLRLMERAVPQGDPDPQAGRKRHLLVGTLGLLIAVVVTGANADDGSAAPRLLAQVSVAEFPRLQTIFRRSSGTTSITTRHSTSG